MKILDLKCKLTNCYLIESNSGWIMVDTDFPDTLYQFLHLLKKHDVDINNIKYLVITHFHPDHAGIAQNLKELGAKLILHKDQVPYVDKLNNLLNKDGRFEYKDIRSDDNLVVSSEESRALLDNIGIKGEIIQTPGHSEDSISLVIDEYCAFVGDLPTFELVEAYYD